MKGDRTIWQPRGLSNYPEGNSPYDFFIDVDRNFALEMLSSKISSKKKDRLNRLAERVLRDFNIPYLNPLTFEDNSALITQIYIGRNGKWLAIDGDSKYSLQNGWDRGPIKYFSHNVDSANESYVLMGLFDLYAEYSTVLKEKEQKQKAIILR